MVELPSAFRYALKLKQTKNQLNSGLSPLTIPKCCISLNRIGLQMHIRMKQLLCIEPHFRLISVEFVSKE